MSNLKEVNKFPSGIINIPPSKSISHRAIICASLANGTSFVENISNSNDIMATIQCMHSLGMSYKKNNNTIEINGKLEKVDKILNCAESGSTLRFLIPIVTTQGSNIKFIGQGRLMDRPLIPYYDTLSSHGVKISLDNSELSISGKLSSGVFSIAGDVSSQFISGLIFSLPLLDGDSEIHLTSKLESASYVDLTLEMVRKFGIEIEQKNNIFYIKGNQSYQQQNVYIEGDYSQVGFFLIASAFGCECECRGLLESSKQGDKKIVEILKNSGVKIIKTESDGLIAKTGKFNPQIIDVSDIPDLVPPLAVFLSFCKGESKIINASRLRIKESDRLNSITTQLNALGANIIEGNDYLIINGIENLKGGVLDSCGDHRIAMMGAIAAIKSFEPVYIKDSQRVSKSYPNFWNDFEKVER